MKWLVSAAAMISVGLIAGCAVSSHAPVQVPAEPAKARVDYLASQSQHAAHATVVPVEPKAPFVEGHPLTSVVVTQCNLIVAVYMTMPNGMLLRFDRSAEVPADQLLAMAYTATRSERVEVNCDVGGNPGVVGFESHSPI